MPTVPDTENVYSTIYTEIDLSTKREVQKTVTIPAAAGKRIKLEKLSMLFQVAASGVEGTAIVTAEVGGVETALKAFVTKNTEYEEQIKTVDFIAGVGKPVVVRWYLKTTGPARSRMMNVAYTFSYVDPEPEPEPETSTQPDDAAYLIIPCASESEADEISEKIKSQVKDIEIYVKSGG